MDIRVAVLGPLSVTVAGREVPLASRRERALLAAMAVSRLPVSVGAVWGDAPPASARNQVQVMVSALRKRFHDLGAADVIRTEGSGYRLGPTLALDWVEFEGALTASRVLPAVLDGPVPSTGRSSTRNSTGPSSFGYCAVQFSDRADDMAASLARLRTALALWRGEPFAGAEFPRSPAVAARFGKVRLTMLEQCAELEIALGRPAAVIGELRDLLAAHPLRERAHAALVLALHRAGQPAEAQAAYHDAERLLLDELGLEPGKRLRGRYAAITDGMPAAITDFTGRHDVRTLLLRRLATRDRTASLTVVSGPAGVGKSTVAVHAVRDLSFPDGQLYVDLRRDPDTALVCLLGQLGVDRHAVPDSPAEQADLFRALVADRQVLVCLDNAADAAQVRPLLPGLPSSPVLITARTGLPGLPGVVEVPVAAFDRDHGVELLARMLGPERVAAEPAAAAELVALCGGLPLALRIVGSRLADRPEWTLAAYARSFADESRRLDELVYGDLSVRAALQPSYAALSASGQRLFGLLGLTESAHLMPGAVAALLDSSVADAEDLLDELVDARLLTHAYRFPELVRLFAREMAADRVQQAQR